ncbi:MAG TPA: YoaK family protein, partial [Polyangiaceae bacterium]
MNPVPRSVLVALVGLTFVTGLIDAASVLGLGHVFVANMTGNVVFLGFSLLGKGSIAPASAALALGSFLLGALLGGWLARPAQPRGMQVGFPTEVALLVLAAAAALLGAPNELIIFLLSFAMGLRNALVRALAVPDMTTTVLTLTLTGLAADSSLAGGANPRIGRRLASISAMLLGAAAGAWAQSVAITGAALIEATAVFALLRALGHARS